MFLFNFSGELACSDKHHLGKGNQVAEDQPEVDHLGGRGGGQHGGYVEECCCLCYHYEEKGREVGGHHLAHDLSLRGDCHMEWMPFLR